MVASLQFSLSHVINMKEKVIYSVVFCSILPLYKNYFAAVGLRFASIYCISGDRSEVDLVQAYVDSDEGENFYASTWADQGDGQPLLALAGKRGIIKVINTLTLHAEAALSGHGNEVMDLVTHSVDHNLIFSASNDESMRLWNIRTRTCVAVFAGEMGHRTYVLSVAVHPSGNTVASSGMDNSIKLWNLMSPGTKKAIDASYEFDNSSAEESFATHVDQFPVFSTSKVHNNYVDCVRWVGDLLLTKSTCNRAVLWTPDPLRGPDAVCILREFSLSCSRLWFMKMAVCDLHYVFAAGNSEGEVQLYHLTPPCGSDQEDAAAAALNFLPEIEKASTLNKNIHERFETGVGSKANVVICHDICPSDVRDSDFNIDGDCFVYCSSSSEGGRLNKIAVWAVQTLETLVPSDHPLA